ncbi:PREDICTED: uncharacterized protein LOC106808578 [Priapulus caudatus]|uniref:Uncharacterized protein LOC106808578 n=1 Tax=Priapulus caudatus TaxID=37621 RepID=A0ABM1E3Q5_PRICU|nr:PREDICTED: uncharacterized protein LOC106808578 [Priapulus caudatus]
MLSVIVIGIDAVSRLNFIRQMPRTYRLLVGELGAVELRGYNKVADNTLVNIVPMLTGRFTHEIGYPDGGRRIDDVPFIWKNFSAAGYRTLLAEDAPYMATFNYLRDGFRMPPVDYYLRPFSIAVDMSPLVNKSTFHCVGDRLELEIVLDYISQLAATFPQEAPPRSSSRPYFAFGWNARISHDSLNLPRVADAPYADFVRRLRDGGHLNRTALLVVSDHGLRYGAYLRTYVGKLEERLPAMFVALPPWFARLYPAAAANLRDNARRLTTPFDVYETLLDVLRLPAAERDAARERDGVQANDARGRRGATRGRNGPAEEAAAASGPARGISLLRAIPATRTCADAGIEPHWCTCQDHRPLSRDDPRALNAARYLVFAINNALAAHRRSCAWLSLRRIADAMIGEETRASLTARVVRSERDDSEQHVAYDDATPHFRSVHLLLTVETQPGNALFEATVKLSASDDGGDDAYELLGDVSRINRYGETSTCVRDYSARKFCYCTELLTLDERQHQEARSIRLSDVVLGAASQRAGDDDAHGDVEQRGSSYDPAARSPLLPRPLTAADSSLLRPHLPASPGDNAADFGDRGRMAQQQGGYVRRGGFRENGGLPLFGAFPAWAAAPPSRDLYGPRRPSRPRGSPRLPQMNLRRRG